MTKTITFGTAGHFDWSGLFVCKFVEVHQPVATLFPINSKGTKKSEEKSLKIEQGERGQRSTDE